MKKGLQKGFTLIELLVVIAIIGILSGIVLTSLGTARGKAKDAKVQSQLSSLRATAEMYFSDKSKYQSGATAIAVCPFASGATSFLDGVSPYGWPIVDAIEKDLGISSADTSKIDCGVSADGLSWAVSVSMPSGSSAGYFCADSTGVARNKTALGVAYTATLAATTGGKAATGGTSCQ